MKQVLNTKNLLVLSSSLLHSISPRRIFSKYRTVLLLAGIALFISSCHKEDHLCKKTVPFKANFKVIAIITQDGDPQIVDVTGMGKGTPIGISTFVGRAEYAGPKFNFTGYGTITDANGDQIFATGIEGPGPVVDTTTGNIVLTYHSIITGGTGRFANATGSYTTIAHASLYTNAGNDSLDGTITLDECNGKIKGAFKNL